MCAGGVALPVQPDDTSAVAGELRDVAARVCVKSVFSENVLWSGQTERAERTGNAVSVEDLKTPPPGHKARV